MRAYGVVQRRRRARSSAQQRPPRVRGHHSKSSSSTNGRSLLSSLDALRALVVAEFRISPSQGTRPARWSTRPSVERPTYPPVDDRCAGESWSRTRGRSGSTPVANPVHQSRRDASPAPGGCGARVIDDSGGVLLSQELSLQVPSALAGLTTVFGMGTGVTPPLWPPETYGFSD